MRRWRRRGAGVVMLLGLVAACGAAPRTGMPGKSAPNEPEPATIEDAEAQIARARAALGLPTSTPPGAAREERGAAPTSTAAQPSAPSPPTPSPAPQTTQAAPPAAESGNGASSDTSAENGGCVDACRAIGSMRRAVGVICRIAGADDPRCGEARRSLDESEQRVARCGC